MTCMRQAQDLNEVGQGQIVPEYVERARTSLEALFRLSCFYKTRSAVKNVSQVSGWVVEDLDVSRGPCYWVGGCTHRACMCVAENCTMDIDANQNDHNMPKY